MTPRWRIVWLLAVVGLFAASCSAEVNFTVTAGDNAGPDAPSDTEGAAEEQAPADQEPVAGEDPAPTASDEPEPAPTSAPEPTAEPEPTPTAQPEPSPTPEPTPVETGPYPILVGAPELFGVAFEAVDVDATVDQFAAIIGSAPSDSGWIVGCPLDGTAADERYVSWGGLSASFLIDGDGVEMFGSWQYRIDPVTFASIPGGPTIEQVLLPDDLQLGNAFSLVVSSYGATPTVDETFGVPLYRDDDFMLLGAGPGVGEPIREAGTPFIGICE